LPGPAARGASRARAHLGGAPARPPAGPRGTSRPRTPAMRRRIGLFGGTFDPPHLGYLALAEWARERLRLDRVLFVPAGAPPHKSRRRLSPAADRLEMTRRAIRGIRGFGVSGEEIERRGPSFTVDTLRRLAARHP